MMEDSDRSSEDEGESRSRSRSDDEEEERSDGEDERQHREAAPEHKEEEEAPLSCQRCGRARATVMCRGCHGQFLCRSCDKRCHRMGWEAHIREPLIPHARDPLAVTETLLLRLVAVEHIKAKVREIVITHLEGVRTAQMRGVPYVPEPPVILLVGNPGTGKTTIADVLAKVFVAVGMASTTIKLRKEEIPSHSPRAFFEELARRVQNGVLVVDELQNYARCTNFTQFLVAQTDKGLACRPVVLLMGYPAPRRPNVDEYLRKSDSGVTRRLTDRFLVPNFTAKAVVCVLLDKAEKAHHRLDVSKAKLCRYVRDYIPPRFYALHNGSLAERIFRKAYGLQALKVHRRKVEDLERRVTISKPIVKQAIQDLAEDLTRDERVEATGSNP